MIVDDEKEDVTNFSDDDNDAGSNNTTRETQGSTPPFRVYIWRAQQICGINELTRS